MRRSTLSLTALGDRAYTEAEGGNEKYIAHLIRQLRRAIDSELSEHQKAAVIGYYFENKSVTDIAKEQGVNKSTVSRTLARARARLSLALRYADLQVDD